MKPYGATKYDTATCAYGCCGGGSSSWDLFRQEHWKE